jgi:hypothetical protein
MQNVKYVFSGFLALLLLLGNARSETLEETYKKSIPVQNQEILLVKNQNGNIDVHAWDREEIEIIAYKKVKAGSPGAARRYMEDLRIEIEDTGKEIRVNTMFPDEDRDGSSIFSWLLNLGGKSASIDYEIRVPSKFNLDIHSTNGNIFVEECEGRFDLETTNGNMQAENVKGAARCKTTNGSITVSLLDVFENEEQSFYSTNGSVKLFLPETLNANLKARTTNGSVECDLPMHDVDRESKRNIEATINQGGPLIYIKTTNGTIHIFES